LIDGPIIVFAGDAEEHEEPGPDGGDRLPIHLDRRSFDPLQERAHASAGRPRTESRPCGRLGRRGQQHIPAAVLVDHPGGVFARAEQEDGDPGALDLGPQLTGVLADKRGEEDQPVTARSATAHR